MRQKAKESHKAVKFEMSVLEINELVTNKKVKSPLTSAGGYMFSFQLHASFMSRVAL